MSDAEKDAARLTDKEIELREWLRSQPSGAERWTVIKAGFRRSYDMGMRDGLNTRPDAESDATTLARDLIAFAQVTGMPDSYWHTDRRIARACAVLGITPLEAREMEVEDE